MSYLKDTSPGPPPVNGEFSTSSRVDRETSLTQSFRSEIAVMDTGDEVAIVQTPVFRDWLKGLRDRKVRVRIDDRLKRLASGHAGDTKSIGSGVRELRLHFGPGYRIYYVWQGKVLIILLVGGDKSTQARDITTAKRLAKEAKDGIEGSSV